MRKHQGFYLAVATLLLVAGAAVSQSPKLPVNWEGLPDPFHTPSASNRPKVVDKPDGAGLSLPPGFHVEEYMSGFEARPRFMMLGPNQEILLTDSGGRREPNGLVYVIQEKKAKKIIEGLDRPFGLAMHETGSTSPSRPRSNATNTTPKPRT